MRLLLARRTRRRPWYPKEMGRSVRWWLGAMLWATVLHAEAGFFTEPLTLPDGNFFCCTKRYASCEEKCRSSCMGMTDCEPKLECVAQCRSEQCQPGTRGCHTDEPGKAANASLRYDGQVSGPGTVRFDVARHGATLPRLAVYGIVYGKRHDNSQIEVLTKTETHVVPTSKRLQFQMTITADQFNDWSKRLDGLTVAIAMPSETDRARWTYRNELTQDDVEKAKAGEMQVKGEFLWRGAPD